MSAGSGIAALISVAPPTTAEPPVEYGDPVAEPIMPLPSGQSARDVNAHFDL